MSDNDEQVYTVEKVLDHKIVDGKTFFLIRWEGYFPEDDTWEPYENICDCTDALDEYRAMRRQNVKASSRDAPKQLPRDFGLPDTTDSESSDVDVPSTFRGPQTRTLTTTTEEEPCSKSAPEKVKKQKKFRRISQVVTSSDSDEVEILAPAEVDNASVAKKKAENVAMAEKRTDEVKPLNISNLPKPSRVANLANERDDPHTNKSQKGKKQLKLSSNDFEFDIRNSNAADARSVIPTEFLKRFHIPRVDKNASDVLKRKENVSKPVLFGPKGNSTASYGSSSTNKQPKIAQNCPASTGSTKRMTCAAIASATATNYGAPSLATGGLPKMPQKLSSTKFGMNQNVRETVTSAPAMDSSTSSVGLREQPKIQQKSASSKIDTSHSVREIIPWESENDPGGLTVEFDELSVSQPSRQSIEDLAYKLKSNRKSLSFHKVDADNISWSPREKDDQSCSQFLGETSNSCGSSTFGTFDSKMDDGSPSLDVANSQQLPALTYLKHEIKVMTEVKPRVVSNEDIETLHTHVKLGDYDKIANWFGEPGRHDWEMVNPRGSTLLMQAAVNGKNSIVKLLLVNGADVNARHINMKTALMIVCDSSAVHVLQHDRLETVKILLAFGAKRNMVDAHGETALMLASRKGYFEIVEFLLEFGADFYIKTKAAHRTYGKEMTAVDFAKTDGRNAPLTTEDHKKIVNMISTLEARVTSAFEAQMKLVLNDNAKLLDPLFDTRIFSLNEDTEFMLNFDYKEQEHEPNTGFLLFVAHALISVKGEVQCRMYGDVSTVSEIKLNGVTLIGITERDHVLSFCPVNEGENRLEFFTVDMQNSDVRLIIRAYRVQILP